MNTICINCYPKFKEVEGIRTSTLVYVNTLQGSEEEIAKFVAKKAEEGYPVQYDLVNNLPLVWFGKHTGRNGNASFNKEGKIYLKDDAELLLLEDELKSEEISEMRKLLAMEIRAIKKPWMQEIKAVMSKTAPTGQAEAKVEDAEAEEADLSA